MKCTPLIFFFFLLLGTSYTPVSANTLEDCSNTALETFSYTLTNHFIDPDSTQTDSIPRIKYIGYRLYLTHFEVVKQKKGYLYIKLSAINTGNKKMQLGKGAAQVFPVVKIDPSIGTAGLLDYQTEIYYKLLEEKLTIPIGAISTKIELKLLLSASDSELAEAEKGEVILIDPPAPTTAMEEPLEEIVVAPEIAATPPPSDSEPKIEIATAPVENTSAESAEPAETVVQATTPQEEVPPVEEEIPVAIVEEEACSDLVFKNINVLKRSKGSITIEYELYNQGTGKAPLIIGSKKDQQSLAIRANLSSMKKLTRGATVISSTFLFGEEISLASGATYTGKLKLSLLKLTKFTPYLVLELDAFEFVEECDESNNLNIYQLVDNELH